MVPSFLFAFATSHMPVWSTVTDGLAANVPTAIGAAVLASLFTWLITRRGEKRELTAAEIETAEDREKRIDTKFNNYITTLEGMVASRDQKIAELQDSVNQQIDLVTRLMGEADAKQQLLQAQTDRVHDLTTQVDRLRSANDTLTATNVTTNNKLTKAQNALKTSGLDCQTRIDVLQAEVDRLKGIVEASKTHDTNVNLAVSIPSPTTAS